MKSIITKIVCMALIVFCTLAMVACSTEASAEEPEDLDLIVKMSSSEADAILAYLNESTAIQNGDISEEDVEYVGTILDRKISRKEFMARYQKILSGRDNYENYGKAAWDSLKMDIWEQHFAEKRDLYPTTNEIKAYVDEVRLTVESTDKGVKQVASYAESLGMTVEDYWNYIAGYVAPQDLNHKRVMGFLGSVNMEPADVDLVTSTFDDDNFLQSL